MNDLLEKSCTPIEKGSAPLDEAAWKPLLEQLGESWEVSEGTLVREFVFPAFETGLDFVNQTGGLAEQEGHHPELALDRRKVRVSLRTHDVDGLSENDFILAAKITDAVMGLATARMVDVNAMKGDSPTSAGAEKLGEETVAEQVKTLGEGWSVGEEGRLERSYAPADYVAALTLVNKIGTLAKERRHHPALLLTPGQLKVSLFTYPVEGLTKLDFELAAAIEGAAKG
ncbi:MAG: 4a-hydroxytetrahydrobiopterin dehydratase [Deltaproteobacteria bacterium]|nr:4a-hydroxytetrahydrobiopterin dehydratase [Deltaproteobacteria bacterium]